MKARARFRPTLEALEERAVPTAYGFSWSGGGGDGNWSNWRNWNQPSGMMGQYPGGTAPGFPQGSHTDYGNDWANFGQTSNDLAVTCPLSQLGGLAIDNSHLTLTLNAALTIKGGGSGSGDGTFSFTAGTIQAAAAGDDLTLDGCGSTNAHGGTSVFAGTDPGGQDSSIGSEGHPTNLTLQNNTTLVVEPAANVGNTVWGNITIGPSGDSQRNTLKLMDGSLNIQNGGKITVGTWGVLEMTGTGEGDIINDSHTLVPGANIDVSGIYRIDTPATSTVMNLTLPTVVEPGGVLQVESHQYLGVPDQLTDAVYDWGFQVLGNSSNPGYIRLGDQNPGDSGLGNATLTSKLLGGIRISTGGQMDVLGTNNQLYTLGDNQEIHNFSVANGGLLALFDGTTNDGSVWSRSSLKVGWGDVYFDAGSTFSFWGKGDNSDYDSLLLVNPSDAAQNVYVATGAKFTPNCYGNPQSTPQTTWYAITDMEGTVQQKMSSTVTNWDDSVGANPVTPGSSSLIIVYTGP